MNEGERIPRCSCNMCRSHFICDRCLPFETSPPSSVFGPQIVKAATTNSGPIAQKKDKSPRRFRSIAVQRNARPASIAAVSAVSTLKPPSWQQQGKAKRSSSSPSTTSKLCNYALFRPALFARGFTNSARLRRLLRLRRLDLAKL